MQKHFGSLFLKLNGLNVKQEMSMLNRSHTSFNLRIKFNVKVLDTEFDHVFVGKTDIINKYLCLVCLAQLKHFP